MAAVHSVAEICRQRGIDAAELAVRAGMDPARTRAIVEGRWLPSPDERDQIAAALGLTRGDIAWSHRSAVQHIHGHGPQFGRSP